MEDEGSYGNDDIRCFILSNLATAKMSKTFCVVCQSAMQIYDRYPLIDGTFFLSPKQYSKACIPVSIDLDKFFFSHVECSAHLAKVIFDLKSAYNRFFLIQVTSEGRQQHLSAVCMVITIILYYTNINNLYIILILNIYFEF